MSGRAEFSDLDAMIGSLEFPVRSATLEQAWDLTPARQPSVRFQERVGRVLAGEREAGEILILVTLRAKPGQEEALEQAAREFVAATKQLQGALSSTLYRPTNDPRTLTLVERFAGRWAVERHMAAPYFRRFQDVQTVLLAQPAEATLFERLRSQSSG